MSESGSWPALESRLAELAALEADWDTYGALAISPAAIERAREVFIAVGIRPWHIVPLGDGGVVGHWRGWPNGLCGEEHEVELEVHPDGNYTIFLVINRPEYHNVPWVAPDAVASAILGLLDGTLTVRDGVATEREPPLTEDDPLWRTVRDAEGGPS